MSLEGRLRDLDLQELCQLLALSRKSGTLHLHAQLEGRAAAIVFHHGAIVDAWISEHGASNDVSNGGGASTEQLIAAGVAIAATRTPTRAADSRAIEATVFELLTWRDGAFAFAPVASGAAAPSTGVRLGTEAILVESTRRSDGWAQLADCIPHAGVVPAFANVEPRQLPLLNLVPQQWEILTRVDGQRDLPALANAMGKDVLEIATLVHGLIGAGLLTLRDVARTERALPTPPAVVAVTPNEATNDLWIPSSVHAVLTEAPHEYDADEASYDVIFDPIRVGVQTPEGLPRITAPVDATSKLLGDDAARDGDLVEAIEQWSAYLRDNEHASDAEVVREAISLGSRLHALLHRASRE